MTAAVETMAYAGGVPWHGLGYPVSNDLTPEEMLAAAKCDWLVGKTPLYFQNSKGEMQLWEDTQGLIRLTDEAQLSPIGTTWKPVQNLEAASFFSNFVKAGSMKMETLGSLWGGRYIWALASIEKSFDLGPKGKKSGKNSDRIKSYLLMANPHVLGQALIFKHTSIRVVCWNTFSAALGRGVKRNKQGELFKIAHSQPFDDGMKERVTMALDLADDQFKLFEEQTRTLVETKSSAEETLEYFCEVAKFDGEIKDGKAIGKGAADVNRYQTALLSAPGQQIPTALGTLWGAWNAVTAAIDHHYSDNAETRMKTAWFGGRAAVKQRALDIALEKAGWEPKKEELLEAAE